MAVAERAPPARLSRTESAAPRLARGGGAARRRRIGLGLVIPLILLVLWEAACRVGFIPPNKLPAPTAVFDEMAGMAATGELFGHIGITLYRVFAGFFLGAAAATVAGSLTGYSRTCRELLDPLVQGFRSVPSLAWVPLFILWLGIYELSKVTLIAVGVFFPVYLNLMSGIQSVDRKLVEVGRVYRLSGWKLVRRVLLPATLPSYLVGLRSGLGLGWMFVIAAELMGASKGLGFLLLDGEQTSRPKPIIGSIILFALFGKLTDVILVTVGNRLVGWQDSFKAQSEEGENAAH
ncbi:MAG TPA: ABC transporter permease [Candidatus Angelobacter sp.]|nr:ABC transporter permease [Candidatus Angelobacter sp.]